MFNLKPEQKRKYINEIQHFFEVERGEEIGEIAADMILDFFLENLGKDIYNQALDDAKKWFHEKMGDLEYGFDEVYK